MSNRNTVKVLAMPEFPFFFQSLIAYLWHQRGTCGLKLLIVSVFIVSALLVSTPPAFLSPSLQISNKDLVCKHVYGEHGFNAIWYLLAWHQIVVEAEEIFFSTVRDPAPEYQQRWLR